MKIRVAHSKENFRRSEDLHSSGLAPPYFSQVNDFSLVPNFQKEKGGSSSSAETLSYETSDFEKDGTMDGGKIVSIIEQGGIPYFRAK